MKLTRSILGIFAFLLVSFGLDWVIHLARGWTASNFVFYPQIILRILANLFMMLIALIFGLELAKNSQNRLLSLVMAITGLGALILPLLPRVSAGLGFMAYYLSLAGALLVLMGVWSILRQKRLDR